MVKSEETMAFHPDGMGCLFYALYIPAYAGRSPRTSRGDKSSLLDLGGKLWRHLIK